MRSLIAVVLCLAWLGVVAETPAGEFKSPKGYKLTYPDGWTALSPAQMAELLKKAGKEPPKNDITDVYLRGTHQEKYVENINVIVAPQVFKFNEAAEQDMVSALRTNMTPPGGKAPEIKRFHVRINGRPSLSLATEFTPQGMNEPIWWWRVMIPGGKQTCLVTCTALKSQWDDVVPNITKVINSIHVDE